MRLLLLALPALSLAACGSDTSEQPATNQAAIAIRSEEQNQLHQLSDLNRDIALKRAILASGLRCKRVVRSGYVTEYNKLSMWQADRAGAALQRQCEVQAAGMPDRRGPERADGAWDCQGGLTAQPPSRSGGFP